MKKTLFLAVCMAGAMSASAGSEPVVVNPLPIPAHAPVVPRHEVQPITLTANVGLMHTDVSYLEGGGGDSQAVPSILYGGSVGVNWDYMKTGSVVHSLGASVGFFTGNEKKSSSSSMMLVGELSENQSKYAYDGRSTSYDMEVYAIPITISYDLKYDLTDSISIYGGIRTGVMIRKTSAKASKTTIQEIGIADSDGYTVGDPYYHTDLHSRWDDVSSTRALPMLGIGAGVQAYITPKVTFNIAYDFEWTFGNDCKRLNSNGGNNPSYILGTSQKHRYYGTVKAGVTYSF